MQAQVISDPNQIVGTIKWTNDPAGPVYPFLTAAGFSTANINAMPLTAGPIASTTVFPANQGDITMPYVITVQAGDPPGIPYHLSVGMSLVTGDNYFFQSVTTDPVLKEPAPDVTTNFCECAGLVKVQFCDTNGNPVTVGRGDINAYILPGGELQADGSTFANVSGGRLIVRGGNTFRVEASISATITTGTSDFLNRFTITYTYTTNYTNFVSCDQIVTNKFIVPPPPDGIGTNGGDLGKIIGRVDMLGEFEHWNNFGHTLVQANGGPYGNYRYDTIEPRVSPVACPPLVGTLTDNSAGAFCLTNLLPSTFQGLNQITPCRRISLTGLAGVSKRFTGRS